MKVLFAAIAAIGAFAGIQELIALSQGYRMSPSLQFGYAASGTSSCGIICVLLIVLIRKGK